MRTYLPFVRDHLQPDWPLSRDNPAFLEELGKTVALFGNLENALANACYALTKPPASPGTIPPDLIEAYQEWYEKVEASRTDTMHVLTGRFGKLLKKDGRIPHTVRSDLRRRLDELRPWRNTLCHGAWFGFSEDSAGVLSYYYKEGDRVVRFQPNVTLNEFSDLRARIVYTIIRLTEAASVAGYDSVFAGRLAAQKRAQKRFSRTGIAAPVILRQHCRRFFCRPPQGSDELWPRLRARDQQGMSHSFRRAKTASATGFNWE